MLSVGIRYSIRDLISTSSTLLFKLCHGKN